jgi:hypothetical protein
MLEVQASEREREVAGIIMEFDMPKPLPRLTGLDSRGCSTSFEVHPSNSQHPSFGGGISRSHSRSPYDLIMSSEFLIRSLSIRERVGAPEPVLKLQSHD